MDFLDRLRTLMKNSNDSDSSLAKKSGVPYTTIKGIFNRNWETAQLSTIRKICEYYNVSLDYMVYGSEGLSDESQMLAAKFDSLDVPGKATVQAVLESQHNRIREYGHAKKLIESNEYVIAPNGKRVPVIESEHSAITQAKYNAMQEARELESETEHTPTC